MSATCPVFHRVIRSKRGRDMRVGGLQKNSMIDFPGKISCVLFLAGCNFNCPYCHNPELAKGCMDCLNFPGESNFYDFLEKRRGFLDGVVISGGEPTLQRDLILLCEKNQNPGISGQSGYQRQPAPSDQRIDRKRLGGLYRHGYQNRSPALSLGDKKKIAVLKTLFQVSGLLWNRA